MTGFLSTTWLFSKQTILLQTESLHTAILIFARDPKEEALHKKWVSGTFSANVEISKALTNHTLRLAEKSGLPYYLFSTSSQRGNNFEERLDAACFDLFKEGYQNILVIGNDTTELKSSDLTLAANYLKNDKLVLGPARDGGIYLLGLSKNHYAKCILSNVGWESNRVFQNLHDYAHKLGIESVGLEEKSDLDNRRDLQIYLNLKGTDSLLKKILIALSKVSPLIKPQEIPLIFQSFKGESQPLRGPPIATL